MTVQKRFIAGASCPVCGAMDRIQRCKDGDSVWMECVACGMQRRPDEEPGPEEDPGKIPTRQE